MRDRGPHLNAIRYGEGASGRIATEEGAMVIFEGQIEVLEGTDRNRREAAGGM